MKKICAPRCIDDLLPKSMKTGFSGNELDAPNTDADRKKVSAKNAYPLFMHSHRSGTGFVFSFLLVIYRTIKNAK